LNSGFHPAADEFNRSARNMKILTQYSTVRIVALHREFDQSNVDRGFDRRLPRIGDLATVVEVYRLPSVGYELGCSSPDDGTNEWLITFSPEDAEFEIVSTPEECAANKVDAEQAGTSNGG
jgi:hypothetical protein